MTSHAVISHCLIADNADPRKDSTPAKYTKVSDSVHLFESVSHISPDLLHFLFHHTQTLAQALFILFSNIQRAVRRLPTHDVNACNIRNIDIVHELSILLHILLEHIQLGFDGSYGASAVGGEDFGLCFVMQMRDL